jgi:hypothetical protein
MGIAVVSFVPLLTTKLDTLWIIVGAALVSLSVSSLERARKALTTAISLRCHAKLRAEKARSRSERSFGIFRIENMSEEGICGIVKDDHRRQQVDRNV